jgi:hypothetical protein
MTRKSRQKPVLIGAPYHGPVLPVGDKTDCLFREGDVVVTSWTAVPISWPRCRSVDNRRGGPGLLVNEELARAVLIESSLAIQYLVGRERGNRLALRQALGVQRFNKVPHYYAKN